MIEDILNRVKAADLDDFRTRVNESERAYENLFVNISSETVNEMMERRLNQEHMHFEIKGSPIDTAAGKAIVLDDNSVSQNQTKTEEAEHSSEAIFKNFLDAIRG